MDLDTALKGLIDAEKRLSSPEAVHSPTLLSEQMYRLGQYTSAVEKRLGELEEFYEVESAKALANYLKTEKSATAAQQKTDMAMAETKGQIKRLSRYVASSWRIHTACMARVNHLAKEMSGSV